MTVLPLLEFWNFYTLYISQNSPLSRLSFHHLLSSSFYTLLAQKFWVFCFFSFSFLKLLAKFQNSKFSIPARNCEKLKRGRVRENRSGISSWKLTDVAVFLFFKFSDNLSGVFLDLKEFCGVFVQAIAVSDCVYWKITSGSHSLIIVSHTL